MTDESQHESHPRVTAGEQFTQTYAVNEDIATDPVLHISQAAFPLTEADFLRLKHRWSQFSVWAGRVLILGIGMLVVPAAKYADAGLRQRPVPIEEWELAAPVIAILLAGVLFLIGKVLPDERTQVMKDIEAHFTSAPRTQHVEGRHQ